MLEKLAELRKSQSIFIDKEIINLLKRSMQLANNDCNCDGDCDCNCDCDCDCDCSTNCSVDCNCDDDTSWG